MVAVLNSSTVVSDADLHKMVDALNAQMERDAAPQWGRIPVLSHVGGRAYIHHLVVDEDKDVAGALAFHDVGKDGHPILVTMAKTVLDTGATMFGPNGVASAMAHENLEAFIDPYCNDITGFPAGYLWHEVCDAVQGQDYKAPGTNVYVSNFCLPHWFNPNSPDSVVDHQRALNAPGQVGPDGYQVQSQCSGETQIGAMRGTAKLIDAGGNQVDGGPNAWRTLLLTGV